MTEKPPILVVPRLLTALADQLEDAYTVHRLWDFPDPEAFLAGPGQQVRVVVAIGEEAPPVAFLERMPKLGLVACTSTGYENVDLDWCRAHGVLAVNGRSANAPDVAEHALALVLAGWRGVVAGDRMIRAGEWTASRRLRTHRLRGRRAGVVGLGAIGWDTARLLEAIGLSVAWWGPNPKPDAPWPRKDTVLDLARDSDVLVLAGRADPSNRHLADRALMDALGPGGLLVNVARGSLLDEAELIAALKEGRLGGAALDVFDPEPTDPALWSGVPNLILTPHHAGATHEAVAALWGQLRENLRLFYAGEPVATPLF